MYEHYGQPLLHRAAYWRRLVGHFIVSSLVVVGALSLGMVGYRFIGRLAWIDAFVESAMLMSGMGPVYSDQLVTDAAKLFAGCYALFAGLVFMVAIGTLVAPILHRFLHKFHLDRN